MFNAIYSNVYIKHESIILRKKKLPGFLFRDPPSVRQEDFWTSRYTNAKASSANMQKVSQKSLNKIIWIMYTLKYYLSLKTLTYQKDQMLN